MQGEKIQTAGKDMVKFQSVMWQGMLMSAGLPTTDTIVYHGFITGEGGIRMSKSLGNVVNPNDVVKEYGTDALRYFLLREISSFEDSPFTMERFKDAYNSGLANGLGNLASRVMKMAETNFESSPVFVDNVKIEEDTIYPGIISALEVFNIKEAMDLIWEKISGLDKYIQKEQPFKLIKENKKKGENMIKEKLIVELYRIALFLRPFLPETSIKIQEAVKQNKMPTEPLFLRKY